MFPPESVTVRATTEAGVDVVQRVDISLGTGEEHQVDLQLDLPREAKVVTVELTAEPTIGVLRHRIAVATFIEPAFTTAGPASCVSMMPFEGRRRVCVGSDAYAVLEADGGLGPSAPSFALATTPLGLWSVSASEVTLNPRDGGAPVRWPLASTTYSIATLGERVFLGASEGVTELSVGRMSPFTALGPPSAFPPTALRVVPPVLLVARAERTDAVPLASLSDPLLLLQSAARRDVLNMNSAAGLWRLSGGRITLATDAGVLSVDVPHQLVEGSDVVTAGPSPSTTDDTPLVWIGSSPRGSVWLHAVEDLDAGVIEVRYLLAPPRSVLTRADSDRLWAQSPAGVVSALRR
ncbi:MAG: hypothetical protein Q8L14_13205 [Myxococcales bacterium]|nr:hypothetical protein [Myxococcales bacterium]